MEKKNGGYNNITFHHHIRVCIEVHVYRKEKDMFAGKIVFLFFSLQVVINGAKLNTPKVLLPYYASEASNTTLKVSGEGCFQWFVP